MKNYLYLVLAILLILFVSSCVSSPSKQECSNGSDTTTLNSNYKKEQIEDIKTNNVLFSTKNIEGKSELSLDDFINKYNLKAFSTGGVKMGFVDLGLPDENLIINKVYGDENVIYYLYNISSSELPNYKKALDITPLRSTPGMEESEYTKNELEIYQDYLIRIYKEELFDGDTSRYENFYRINDQGEFYEVNK